MDFAVTTDLPPDQAELGDLYEIVDGVKVWPRIGEPETDGALRDRQRPAQGWPCAWER